MSWPCESPDFPYNATCGWYERCTNCGRAAWEHEQSDPMQDVYEQAEFIRAGDLTAQPPPPAMKP